MANDREELLKFADKLHAKTPFHDALHATSQPPSLTKASPLPPLAQIDFEGMRRTVEARAGFAWSMFDSLKQQLEQFQDRLGQAAEVGAILANFGSSTRITVLKLSYRDPHLIIFHGEDGEGRSVELLQHVSHVALLLVAVPLAGRPARRIGFEVPSPE